MAKNNTNNNSVIYGEEFEYQMASSLAKGLLNGDRKINDRQQFLIDYVNREFGLKGICTKVIVN